MNFMHKFVKTIENTTKKKPYLKKAKYRLSGHQSFQRKKIIGIYMYTIMKKHDHKNVSLKQNT